MKYKLVPVKPTREMWAAAGDAVVALNSQHHDAISSAVYKAMLAAAPEVEQDLVGWVVVGPGDCMSDIQTDRCHAVDLKSDMDSELPPHHAGPAHEVKPLYLHPQPAPDVAELVDALEEIVQWVGRWAAADHPVATVARKALAAYRQQGGEA